MTSLSSRPSIHLSSLHGQPTHTTTTTTTNNNKAYAMDRPGYLDALHPTARHYLSLGTAFVAATVLRSICFNPRLPIFGPDFQKNLAPIERDDISWSYIAATRLFDLAMFIALWRRETGGHRRHVDAPVLGGLLSSIERLPLYLLLSHFFLLSYKTLFQVLLTDIFSSSVAMYVISRMEPKRPSFFPVPTSRINSITDLFKDRTKLETVIYGIGLSTLINALYSYISEHAFLGQFIRDNVLENEIPAYFSALKPALSEALQHPTYTIPILRSHLEPLSMPEHISHALPLSLLVTALCLIYLPQKSPLNLAGLVAIYILPSNALSVYNLLPIKGIAAIAIGLENALRASTAAYIIAWITEDWRRPLAVKHNHQNRLTTGDPAVILKDVTQADADEIYIVEKNSVTVRKTLSP